MEALGASLAEAVAGRSLLVGLRGELGAGKTTLVRGLLRRLAVEGPIRSPTYTLIEPYDTAGGRVFHLDLYRIRDPEELALIGVRDLLSQGALVLVEWPERAAGALPPPDLAVTLSHRPPGREVALAAHGDAAAQVIEGLRPPEACTVLD
jgi:tRNA threonylcarbamoyladenosine biosynthesis protein TsaE